MPRLLLWVAPLSPQRLGLAAKVPLGRDLRLLLLPEPSRLG